MSKTTITSGQASPKTTKGLRELPLAPVNCNYFLSVPFLLHCAERHGCEIEVLETVPNSLVMVNAPAGHLFCTTRTGQICRSLPNEAEDTICRQQVIAEVVANICQGYYRNPSVPQPGMPTTPATDEGEPTEADGLYVVLCD